MPSILVKPAGQPVPRVEKRVGESIVYSVSCIELLEPNEIIVSTQLPTHHAEDIVFSSIRSRAGTSVELRVENTTIAAPYVDYIINIEFTTNFHNKKLAVFQLRVHK